MKHSFGSDDIILWKFHLCIDERLLWGKARQGNNKNYYILFVVRFFFLSLSFSFFACNFCYSAVYTWQIREFKRHFNVQCEKWQKHKKPERYNMIKQRNMNSSRNSIVIIFEIFSFIEWNGGQERKRKNPAKYRQHRKEKRQKAGQNVSEKRMKIKIKKIWKNVLLSPLCDRSNRTDSFMLWPRRSLCLVHKF